VSGFKIDRFTGIFPRVPESLLPVGAASIASNCDFGYGELRNTKAGFALNQMANAPASIYTDDGLTFYTWATDVNAVRSPLVRDTFNRLYFTDGTRISVAVRTLTSINGGPPGSSYQVGVPRPAVAPALTTNLPVVDETTATFVFKFHYEAGGIKYQEQTITPTPLGNQEYRFVAPAMIAMISFNSLAEFPETGQVSTVYKALDTNLLYTWAGTAYAPTTTDATPSNAVAVLRATATAIGTNAQLFDIYSENSTLAARSGLYTMTLTSAGLGSGMTIGGAIANAVAALTYVAKINVSIRESEKETRAYVYTYVNTYNEEGPPSAAGSVDTHPDIKASVTVTRDAIGQYAPIKEIRVYRTATGSEIPQYFYAGAIQVLGVSGTTFVFQDNTPAASLNEPLSSTDYYPPPADLVGLMSLPNGILCAWRGNELWFSEAYKPWAWNPENAKPLPHRIVGGISHGAGAVITTVGNPFIVSGVAADQMTTIKLNVEQAGVSKWSIASVNGSVVYASNDGIVTLNGASATLAPSEIFFTRDVWRLRYAGGLSSMRFSVWDGRLVVFSSAQAFAPFMLKFDEAAGSMTDLPDLTAACAFISQLSDQFYFAWGQTLYQFNGGTDQQATWESREMVVPRPTSYGIMQTVATGAWTITFTAALDVSPPIPARGTRVVSGWTITVGATSITMTTVIQPGTRTVRIPGGFKSDRWKVRAAGQGRLREMRVATAGAELAGL
jgi:hypothetical protein